MAYGLTDSAGLVHASAQYFTAASSASLNFTSDFTVEGWYKFTASNIEYVMASRGWDAAQAGHNWWFLYDGAGNLSCLLSNGSAEHAGTVAWTPTTATWYHLALSYDHTNTQVIFYVNGTQQGATQTGYPSSVQSTSKVTCVGTLLGGAGADEGISFGGQVSLVRLWTSIVSGSTLTANKCTVFGGAQTNMVAEWSLDNVLTDASGNTNTLTNVNTATFSVDTPSVCAVVATLASHRALVGVGI